MKFCLFYFCSLLQSSPEIVTISIALFMHLFLVTLLRGVRWGSHQQFWCFRHKKQSNELFIDPAVIVSKCEINTTLSSTSSSTMTLLLLQKIIFVSLTIFFKQSLHFDCFNMLTIWCWLRPRLFVCWWFKTCRKIFSHLKIEKRKTCSTTQLINDGYLLKYSIMKCWYKCY